MALFKGLSEKLNHVFSKITKRGTLTEVAAWYREHEPKGEIVIIVAGAPEKKKEKKSYKDRDED